MNEYALTPKKNITSPPTKVITSSPRTPTNRQRQRAVNVSSVGRPSSSPSNTPRCKGVSLTTGLACKRPVASNSYCYQHRGQLHAESIFGIPKPRHNNFFERITITDNIRDISDLLCSINGLSITETEKRPKTSPLISLEPIFKSIAPNSIQTPPPTSDVLKQIKTPQRSLHPRIHLDASLNEKSSAHIRSKSETSSPINYPQHDASIHNNLNSPNDEASFRQSPGSDRCQGRSTRTGKQCSRSVKVNKDVNNIKQWYCHQHKVVVEKNHPPIESPAFVPGQTKLLLLEETSKPISSKDEPGYIYAYELIDGPLSKARLYKVGRANNVHRRVYQWNRQCGYEPSVIEYFPSINENENTLSQLITEPMRKCKYTHRAERLIHIELGDKYHTILPKCPGCGNSHREFFKVPISNSDGWDEIRRVIVHWITYIEQIYGTG
ncbi:8394_t:CDS:2 [Ambispora leptoticha]|uniref:8394_t:CDS:1 n=1 Tax=Ambispora leptoticha TaxID=144679 RepID=A0A9N8Z9L5_9GLOM|nr:8394_t:CDS:2 [Ambispora leptoticha]